MDSYYAMLSVTKESTTEELTKSYRKLSLKVHPDKRGGSEEAFQKLNRAYEVLKDEKSRAAYDRFGFDLGDDTSADDLAQEIGTHANRAVGVPGAAPSRVEVAQEVKLRLVDAPQPARLMDVDKNTNKRRNPMSEEKQKYISTLMKKHGRDFAKMARDRKRNPQQFTSTKLRKMVELYESLSDDQRVVVA